MPDPDLEIGGGGVWGRSSRLLDKRRGGLPKKCFRPFGPQFGPKIWEGRGGGVVFPPSPSPGSTTAGDNVHSIRRKSPALSS